jgi:hypothetical protein
VNYGKDDHPMRALDERDAAEDRRWLEEQKRLADAFRVVDDPALDATDLAHPAWWRGHDFVADQYQQRLEACRAIVEAAIEWNELYDSAADEDSIENVGARLRLSEAVEIYKRLKEQK